MPIFSPDRHACAPSYVKLTKQPIAGGTYRPLANDEDSNACAPSTLSGHHSSRLYTQKSAIRATSDNTSVFIPNVDAHHLPETADNKSVNEAVDEAANDNIHSAPPSTEIQLAQTDEYPLMQAVEVCKQAAHTTAKTLSTAGHAVAKAAKTTGHAIHTAATAVKNAWHTFINFKAVQLIIKFFRKAYGPWKKRMRFSYAFYAIVFTLLTSAEVIFLQWGMYSEPTYDKGDEVDQTTKILNSVAGQVTKFVSQMWLEQKYQFLLSLFALAIIYLVFIFVTNRFWIATLLFGILFTIYGTADNIKMGLRNEPIIPADLSFVTGGDSGKLLSFIPEESQSFVNSVITVLAWFICCCIVFFIIDGRRSFIYCSWKRPFASIKNFTGTLTRIVAAIASIALLCSYSWNLSIPGSWAYSFAGSLGYTPSLFDTKIDAQTNGPVTTFLSLAKTKVIEKPKDYNRDTMTQIAEKYSQQAISINNNRQNDLTDSTVVMILSETFSDPTRIPGISFSTDPIPNIHAIKDTTTSGLMLSSGYGGGTANMEYQALTGLSLSIFDDSLIIPFQQLVPNQKNPYAFNQIWNNRYGADGSDAVHPYYQSMYLRNVDYKKFGFSHLRTLDSTPSIKHKDTIDYSPYVSDEEAYKNIIDLIEKQKHPQFLQLSTMQNHMPYTNWYIDNEFVGADTSTGLSADEYQNLETYTKGLNLTDQATASFLDELNQIDKPITVIFYGDHLPSIYSTADQDTENHVALHETDYFIWSNSASASSGTKLDASNTAFTSPNYFMSLAANHMNAKVSPYLALLTQLLEQIPAASRIATETGGISSGDTTYLDMSGNQISKKSLSKDAKQLLRDYELVQYDMTAGKGYLNNTDFTKVQ